MANKFVNNNIALAAVTATTTSVPTNIQEFDKIGLFVTTTGTAAGSVQVQVAADYDTRLGTSLSGFVNYGSAITFSSGVSATYTEFGQGATSNSIPQNLSAMWVQYVCTISSGTGTATVTACYKSI